MTITQANAVNRIAGYLIDPGDERVLDAEAVADLLSAAHRVLSAGLTPEAFLKAREALDAKHRCRSCGFAEGCTCTVIEHCARCARPFTSPSQYRRLLNGPSTGGAVCKAQTVCAQAAALGAWD